VNLGYLKVNVA